MRISLVRPLSWTSTYDPEVQEPLGLLYLAAALRRAGHEVLVLDGQLDPSSASDLAGRIAAFGGQVVGTTLVSPDDLPAAATLMADVADRMGASPVFVAGGSLATTSPRLVRRSLPPEVVVFRGESEASLTKFVNDMERDAGAEVRGGIVDPVPSPLDDLPPPARDFAGLAMARNRSLNVQSSRGCTGSCSYCCTGTNSGLPGRGWRGMSADRTADELAALAREHGTKAFAFVDDDFLGPADDAPLRARSIEDAFAARGLAVGFSAQLRIASITPESARSLANAGLAWAFVGLESDRPEVMRRWHRPRLPDDAWERIALLRRHGVEVVAGAIPFHPETDIESLRRFAELLHRNHLLDPRTASNRLHLLPGSLLHAQLAAADPEATFPPLPEPLERLHGRLEDCLAPIRPTWIQVAHQMPTLACLEKATVPVERSISVARGLLHEVSSLVFRTLSELLSATEGSDAAGSSVAEGLREANFLASLEMASRAERGGLVPDPGQLGEAIRRHRGWRP
ncbi:MAG TPA: radical SAM protein [Fibrobacteria bacterium]|nr:radical SAM protein [Fibrobacteria bacterium]HOX50015.1 radical SAM protein [Fibrobacteria bacterium]